MGLERNFNFFEDVVNVMAQIKQPMEDIDHPNTSVKKFKEMVKAPKRRKKVKAGGLNSKTFQFLKVVVLI
jgi:hypothetical protein